MPARNSNSGRCEQRYQRKSTNAVDVPEEKDSTSAAGSACLYQDVIDWRDRSSFALRFFLFTLVPISVIIILANRGTVWSANVMLCAFLSSSCYLFVFRLIPPFASSLKRRGLFGKDLNKAHNDKLTPESLGLVSSAVFLICTISCQLLFSKDPTKLLEYNSGLLAICCMSFLGFVDDVLDLRWRYKMILPLFSGIPLIVAYRGPTTILVPGFVQTALGVPHLVDLGLAYHIYMMLLAIFCTNSINIYAGINGLEVGQAIVMCVAVMMHNLLSLQGMKMIAPEATSAFAYETSYSSQHLFSLLVSLPFFGCSSGLLVYNWYPAMIFVGDTFTYFAGMYFAVVGILGHFSKTLLLFFIPQILNFLLSIPQLLGWIPCPRHRLPTLNKSTGYLEPSKNWTLINLALYACGPMKEERLCFVLLSFQAICCALGLYIRHWIYPSCAM